MLLMSPATEEILDFRGWFSACFGTRIGLPFCSGWSVSPLQAEGGDPGSLYWQEGHSPGPAAPAKPGSHRSAVIKARPRARR